MNWINLLLPFFIILNSFALTLEDEKKYDELEGFVFVKTLFSDKKYYEVIKHGENINSDNLVKNEELGDFYYFMANSYFNVKKLDLAKLYLDKSKVLNKSNPNEFYLTYAKLNYEQKNFEECILNLDKVNKWILKLDDWKLYTKCFEAENKIDDLLAIYLNTSIDDFDYILEAQRVLIKYNLLQIAKDFRSKLSNKCYEVNDYINLLTILEESKIKDVDLIELAHRCHPKSVDVSGHLIKTLYQESLNNSLAYLFLDLSLDDSKFRKHTAEFYKVAKREIESYYYSSIADNETYVMARADKYLNSENVALLYAMPIHSSLLSKNRDLTYAKSYAALKYSKQDEARSILIKNYTKKTAKEDNLLAIIDKCNELDYKCRP